MHQQNAILDKWRAKILNQETSKEHAAPARGFPRPHSNKTLRFLKISKAKSLPWIFKNQPFFQIELFKLENYLP